VRWIKCDGGFELGIVARGGTVGLSFRPPRRDPSLTVAEAREVALELQALAERIDPQPPPRRAAPAGKAVRR